MEVLMTLQDLEQIFHLKRKTILSKLSDKTFPILPIQFQKHGRLLFRQRDIEKYISHAGGILQKTV